MIDAILATAPAISISLFIWYELPDHWKRKFFQLPLWFSSTLIAIVVGFILQGVMGPLTGFITDVLLFFAFLLMRKRLERLDRRNARKQLSVQQAT